MADRQKKVSLIFDADTSKVQSKIDSLSSSLQKVLNLSSRSSGVSSLDEDLRNAGNAAAQLQVQLNNAFNVNTGKLDLSKFHESLNRGRIGIQDYHTALTSIGSSGQTAFMNLARSISNAEIPLKRSNELLDRFATSLKNTVQWQLSSSLMHGFIGAIQSAMSYAEHLNKNLTDIRIVTGQSAEEMARFAEQANKSARELSATTNQYAQAALIFYQQGLNDKAVKERTDAVIKMANVTGEAAKDVSSYMTAIWNNYDNGSKSIEYYADVITKLGAATAASSEEIAGGLEKFAAIGNTIGLSYEYATAMITTIVDKTRQSEDVVGTALKTILARIQGLNLGETLDDGTTLNKYSSALASVGVQIKDATGELRSMDEVLDDLGSKWQTLSKDTQIALAQTVGGVRQYNQIISLMENWDAFKMNVDIAFDAEGSLDEQAKIYAESWKASQQEVQGALEAIWSSLIDENFFISVNKMLAQVLGLVDNFIDGIGGIQGVLTTLGTIAVKVFGNQISKGLKDLTYNISSLTKTGTQQLEKFQKKTRDLLKETAVDKGTTGSGMMADAFKREAEAQAALAQASKNMSEEERAVASILQQQLQARVDNQIEASRVVDLTEQELNNIKQTVDKLVSKNEINLTIPEGVKTDWDQLKQDITEVTTFNPATSNLFNDFTVTLNDASLNTEEKIEKMKNSLQDFEKAVGSIEDENIKTIFESLKKSVESTNFDNIKRDLNEFVGSLSGDARTRIEEFIMATEEMAQKMRKAGDVAKAVQYDKMASELKELVQKTDDYSKALDRGAQAAKDAGLAQQNLQDFLEKTGIRVLSTQDKIVKFADILGTMATVVTTISGVWETLNDESKSTGEKIMAVVSAMAILIPMIVSASTSIKEMGVSAVASKMALEGHSVAAIKGATANMTFGASLNAALGPIGWVVLAIGGLTAAIALLVSAYKDMDRSTATEKRAKELSENYKECAESADLLKTKAQEVQDVFNQYTSIQETLANCKKGTDEWRDSMAELATFTSEVLAETPMLRNIMTNPEAYGYSGSINSETGALDFGAALEYYNNLIAGADFGSQIYTSISSDKEQRFNNLNNYQDEALTQGLLGISDEYNRQAVTWGLSGRGSEVLNDYYGDIGENFTADNVYGALWGDYASYLASAGSSSFDEDSFEDFLNLQFEEYAQEVAKQFIFDQAQIDYQGMQTQAQWGETEADRMAANQWLEDNENYAQKKAIYSEDIFGDAYQALENSRADLISDKEFIQSLLLDVPQDSIYRGINETLLTDYSKYLPIFTDFLSENSDLSSVFSGETINGAQAAFMRQYFEGLDFKEYNAEGSLTSADNILLNDLFNMYYGLEGLASNINFADIFQTVEETGTATFKDINDNEITVTENALNQMAAMYQQMFMTSADHAAGIVQQYENLSEIDKQILQAGGSYKDVLSYAEIEEQKQLNPEGSLINWGLVPSLEEEIKNSISSDLFKNLTASALDNFLGLEDTTQGFLTGLSDTLPLEDKYQFLQELASLDYSQGAASIEAFESKLKELGYTVDQLDPQAYEQFKNSLTQGFLDIQSFSGLNGQNISYAQALINGESLGKEELEALQTSGLDIMKLQSSAEGKDYFNQVMSDYMGAIQQLGMVKSNFGSRNQQDWDAIAQAYGFENIMDEAIEEKFGSDQGFRDAIQNTLDSTDFDALAASIAQIGLDAADTINSLGPEYYDKYLETMIKAQAEIEGIELDDSFWKEPKEEWEANFNNLNLGNRLGTGITELINNYTDLILSGTGKELATLAKDGAILTPAEKEQLNQMRSMVGNILGLNADDITDDFLSLDSTQEALEDIASAKSAAEIEEAYQRLIVSAIENGLEIPETLATSAEEVNTEAVRNFAETYMRNTYEEVASSISDGLQQGMAAVQADDYSDISQQTLRQARAELTRKSRSEKDSLYMAQQLGYVDEGGLITKAGEIAGYGKLGEVAEAYIQQMLIDVSDSMATALDRYDPDKLIKLSNSVAEESLKSLFKGFEDGLGTSKLTYSQAEGLVKLFENVPDADAADQLSKYIQEVYSATGDIDKTIATLSDIDWETITVEELAYQLEMAGVEADYLGNTSLWNLINAMRNATTYTDQLSAALNNYSNSSNAIEAIRNGETITPEQYQTVSDLTSLEYAQENFTMDAYGNYAAVEGTEEGIVNSIRDGMTNNMNAAVDQANAVVNQFAGYTATEPETIHSQYTGYEPVYSVQNAQDLYNLNRGQDVGIGQYVSAHSNDFFSQLGIDDNTIQESILKALGQDGFGDLDSILADNGLNINDFSSGLQGVASQKQEEAIEAQASMSKEDWNADIKALDLDPKEIDEYGDKLQELAEDSEYLADTLKADEKAADKMAVALKRFDRGLETVSENTKKWTEGLEEVGSIDYADTVEEMTSALEDIYNIDPGSLDGIELDWERMNKNLVAMAEGTMEEAEAAYWDGMDQIQDALIQDMSMGAIDDSTLIESLDGTLMTVGEFQQQIYDDLHSLEIGAVIDGGLLDSLNQYVNAVTNNVADAQTILEQLGVDGQVVYDTAEAPSNTAFQDIEGEVYTDGSLNVPIVASDGSVETQSYNLEHVKYSTSENVATSVTDFTVPAMKIVPSPNGGGNITYSGSAAPKRGATGRTSPARRSGRGGGGRRRGGGSRRRARDDTRRTDDSSGGGDTGAGDASDPVRASKKRDKEKERYHSILNVLEDLTRAYEKTGKAADRAFGKARIKLLNQQEKELQKLAAAQKDYIDEINKFYEQDKTNLEQVSAFAGVGIELNGYGSIMNFDEIQDAMWNAYNSHINANEEVIGMDDEAWGKYEEEWQDMIDLIDQYEETQDLREEALEQLQEYINQIYDLQLEKVTYAVEIDIESAEFSLSILEHLLGRIEDDAWNAAKAIAIMGDEANNILEQNDTMQSGIRDILMNHTKDIIDADGEVLKAADLTEEEVEAYLNGDPEALEKIKQIGLDGGFTADEVETLKEYHEKLLEISESLIELREQVYATVLNSFEQFNEEMDHTISKMRHLINITNSYRNIVDIVGKENLGVSNALLESVGQAGVEQSINTLEASRLKKETIQAEIVEAEKLLEDLRAQGLEEDVKLMEENLKVMYDSLYEAEEEFMASWSETMEYINEQFQLTVKNISEVFSDMVSGPFATSLNELQNAFARQQDLDSLHLEDYEKIYEFSRLTRDITNSIDNTENVQAKQELAKLQAEINELEESGVEISRYQMENLRRRYELKVAELALTEAQNAKSKVQMSRDSDGNWNYVYTADDDVVKAAEQNYEDRLYALQYANGQYINEMQNMLIQTQLDLQAKIEEITADETLSMEEKYALIQQYTDYYTQKFNEYSSELDLVLDNNALLYEEDWQKYSEITGYKISADDEYVDHFNETSISIMTGIDNLEDYNSNFQISTETMLISLAEAFESWSENVNTAMTAAGTSVENFATDMSTAVDDAIDDSNRLSEDMEGLSSDIQDTFSKIITATSNWASAYSASIDATIKKNTELAQSYAAALEAWSDYQTATDTSVDDDNKEETQETIGQDGEGSGFGGGGPGGGSGGSEETDGDGNGEPEPDDHEKVIGKVTVHEGYQYWGYTTPEGGEENRVKVVNTDRVEHTYEFTEMDTSNKYNRVWIPSEGVWMSTVDPGHEYRIDVEKYDTGGYTGNWHNNKMGKWAVLHEKELVLNKEDTENMLTVVDVVRKIAQQIDLNAISSAGYLTKDIIRNNFDTNGHTLEQRVHITAEFPNASDKNEIYQAFSELINLASQYAYRKD